MQLARIKTDIGTAVAAAWIDGAVIELPASQESATTTGRSPSTRDCRSTSTRSCSPSCRAAPWAESGSIIIPLKAADTFGPMGPTLIPGRTVDPQTLTLLCRVNGEEKRGSR